MRNIQHCCVFAGIAVSIDHRVILELALFQDSPDLFGARTVTVLITSSYPFAVSSRTIFLPSASTLQDIEGFSKTPAGLVAVASLLVAVLGVIFTAAGFFRRASKEIIQDRRSPLGYWIRNLLLDYVEQRASVADGLRQAIRIDLNLTYTPGAVPVELRVVEGHESQRSERSTEDTIAQIFNKTGGRLLILGDPGTGKSNLLNELARDLVGGARENPEHRIPIVLNLARWTLGERLRTLADWIRDDLHHLYGLTLSDAETLIHDNAIILLLDGLDEVDEAQRLLCVEAINAYQKERTLGQFAVCCRWEEYAQLIAIGRGDPATVSQVSVRWAIRVERLSQSDIERELSRPGLDHVREFLQGDPELRSFVDTPLWLHVLFLGALASPLSFDAENPRDRLYDNYVSHVLTRRPEGTRQKRTDTSKLLRFLGWLAAEMKDRHQTQFLLENLDWSWTSRCSDASAPGKPQLDAMTKKQRVRLAPRLMFGSGAGLLGGAAGGWIFGLLVGMLAAFRVEGRVEAAEQLQFDWRRAISRWPFSLAYGGIFALVFTWLHGRVAGAYLWLFAAMFEMFQGGFRPRSGDGGVAPNRTTMRSLRYALTVTLAGAILALAAIAGAKFANSNHLIGTPTLAAITDGARWIAFAAFILGGEKGGWFVICHYAARAVLWRKGVIPSAYVQFLNESVERLFLIRRGGTYEFIHLTFRDYMAAHHDARDPGFRRPKRQIHAKRTYYPARANMVLARFPACKTAGLNAN